MGKELATQFKKAKRVSYRINLRRNMPRHILIKLTTTKYKEQILKAASFIQVDLISLIAQTSTEILQAKREWQDIPKVMKGGEKTLQSKLFYPERISFRFKGEIKSFTEKQKLRDSIETSILSCKKQSASLCSIQDTGCQGLLHGDDPER